jgi:hypothetical protein
LVNLPLALVGGVAGVFLAGGALSVAPMLGFITLFGIATSNGIMLVADVRHLIEKEGVVDFREAVERGDLRVEQAASRVRMEAFNLFSAPEQNFNNANFGQIASQANSPRQMQFGVKLTGRLDVSQADETPCVSREKAKGRPRGLAPEDRRFWLLPSPFSLVGDTCFSHVAGGPAAPGRAGQSVVSICVKAFLKMRGAFRP